MGFNPERAASKMSNPASKPVKESIAFYWLDDQGRFSAVKRSDDDDSLPGVWGLPGGSLREGETAEDTVMRAGRDKLGIEVKPIKSVGDDSQDRGEYVLHLTEYKVKLVSGEPHLANADATVSHYSQFQMSADPKLLVEAAEKGSSCSRIFLRNRALWPQATK